MIVAVNATEGSDLATKFLNGHYAAALLQMTVTVAELAGQDRIFSAERATSGGGVSGPTTVNMINGVTRFTLSAGETIAMVEL